MRKPGIKERNLYLKRVQPHIGTNIIKVLVGHRRAGKSYLMLNIINSIMKIDGKANIIYINKEEYEFDSIKNYHDLQAFFDSKYQKKRNNYFFVDEIQEIEDFERCIRNIFSTNLADIYISGSNADMLSGELATMLSGRYIEVRVHPLSYPEYLDFFEQANSVESFNAYLKQGGMPGLLHINRNEEPVRDYLRGILSTILLKDVVARYNIRNVSFLDNLVRYLSGNIGSLVSAKSISDFLKSQRIKVSPNLVLDYLSHLSSAYFTNKVLRFDVVGKRVFEIGEKYYFEDLGLRNILTGYNPNDISKLLENVVYNHLVIAGFEVNVGYKGDMEIDFVAVRNGETIYVQVCYLLTGERVMEHEFGNLLSIPDNYKKYVVSMDSFSASNTYKGIEHISVPDFCLFLLSEQ
jgi:hypothetical protein